MRDRMIGHLVDRMIRPWDSQITVHHQVLEGLRHKTRTPTYISALNGGKHTRGLAEIFGNSVRTVAFSPPPLIRAVLTSATAVATTARAVTCGSRGPDAFRHGGGPFT